MPMPGEDKVKPDINWYPDNFDWYLKWFASMMILTSLAMRSAGPDYRMYDLTIGFVGITCWLWVSIIWKDRALIMLNAVSGFMLAGTILREW